MFSNEYCAPESIEEAINILSTQRRSRIIAGGTDLLVQMRNRLADPALIVDVRHLPLDQIKTSASHVTIGSRVTYTRIVNNKLLHQHFPALVHASQLVGGPPTRNRGTIGGNLVNASPAADTIPPLLIYDANLIITGKDGRRTIPLSEFYTGYRKTRLTDDELLEAIELPLPPERTAAQFIKHGNRRALYIAAVNVAVRISTASNGIIQTARVALGCVGPTVFIAGEITEALEGRRLDEEVIAEAANTAVSAITPISDGRASAGYRSNIVAVLVKRGLWEVARKLDRAT